jgi:hypothetical protein
MTKTGADMPTITLEKGLATFLNTLSGKNRSAATIRAYSTDIAQSLSGNKAFIREDLRSYAWQGQERTYWIIGRLPYF